MTELNPTTAGLSSEGPAVVLCTKCKKNPRSRSNSSWCKQCHNDYAALYRLRARPRERTEERMCLWKDCDETFTWRSTHAKRICCSQSHYMKWRYWESRPPEEKLPEGAKRCSKCGTIKVQAEFSPSQYAKRKGGQCRCCWAVYSKQWQRDNKERRSASTRKANSTRLLRRYRAYTDDFDQIVIDQGGVCKACGGQPGAKGFQIDHDHATNLYRGLLCHWCNLGIGSFQDDVAKLQGAITYLTCSRDVLTSPPSPADLITG